LRVDRPTPAVDVDHIIPKYLDGSDDPDNLQSLCRACHKQKSKQERMRRTQIGADGWPLEDPVKRWGYSIPDNVQPSAIPVILVSGPPAAGKTTYISENATEGDLVIDFDVYRMRAGVKKWDTRRSIWRKAFEMRDRDIRSLSKRLDGKCYLIVTAPTKEERETWVEALGDVTIKLIKTSEEDCIKRIRQDPERREAADSQIKAVKHWWTYN